LKLEVVGGKEAGNRRRMSWFVSVSKRLDEEVEMFESEMWVIGEALQKMIMNKLRLEMKVQVWGNGQLHLIATSDELMKAARRWDCCCVSFGNERFSNEK